MGMLIDWDGWVHRRIESVELKDPLRFKRRVSLDFRYPTAPPPEYSPEGDPIVVIPLTLLRKRTLLHFSLRDETGRVLPLLTRSQNAKLAAAVLAVYAEWKADTEWARRPAGNALRNRPVPLALFDEFCAMAAAPRDVALRLWEGLGRQPEASRDHFESAWREAMVTDPRFMALARDVAFNYLALTPLVGGQGQRRVIKFSYEEVLEEPVSRLRVRVRELRARLASRRGRRRVRRGDHPRGKLRISAVFGLDDPKPCDTITVRITSADGSGEVDCTFEEKRSRPIEVELPVGNYELRAVVPEGLTQFRPGPFDVTAEEGKSTDVQFKFIGASETGPRSEYRDSQTRPWFGERLFTGLCWRAKRVVVITPAIGHGGSYHFEAEAPEGLFVSRAALSEDRAARTGRRSSDEPPLALDMKRERIHLAAPAKRQDYSAIVILKLRPRPWTIIRPATLSALFTSCVLFAVALRWPSIGTNAGAVATLLLLVPGGLSAWAARSQENPVTTEVLFGLRILSLAAGLWAFIGAAALVLNRKYDATNGSATVSQPWPGTEPLLWTLFGLSAVTAVVLVIAWWQGVWLAENRGKRRRQPAGMEPSA